MIRWLTILLFLRLAFAATAQVVTTVPQYPKTDDTITLFFDATAGNLALKDFTGNVYGHFGLITTQSTSSSDWKNVVGKWGQADTVVLMTRISSNRYSIRFSIRTFFSVQASQTVLKIACLFRNANGSLVCRSSANGDIFYPINLAPPGRILSYTIDGPRINFKTTTGILAVTRYSDKIIKVGLSQDSLSQSDTSYSVCLLPTGTWQSIIDTTDFYKVYTSTSYLKIYKNPMHVVLMDQGYPKVSELPVASNPYQSPTRNFSIDPTEAFYGTGSRAIDIDLRGKLLAVYNQANYGYSFGAQNLNLNVPLVISTKNYGLFFDNFSSGTFDIGSSDSGILSYSCDTFSLNYFIINGNSFAEILSNYTVLTGRQPLPPKWALGYIQSKYGYQNETEARSIVSQLESANFPLDALVLDLYWFGSKDKMGTLNWDGSKWTNPTLMMSNFKSTGVKTIAITEPYFTQSSSNYAQANAAGYFAKNTSNQTYVMSGFWAGSAALLDIYLPAAREWFWNFYQQRNAEGIEGWWCDLGEPETHPLDMIHSLGKAKNVHNLYAFFWADLLKRKHDLLYPQKRLFNLSRSGFAGSQRFGVIPWGGDIQRSWNGLKAEVPVIINCAMSGIGMMHSDAGGFTGGSQDDELYTRWLQFAAFCPVMRAHGEGQPTEPVFYNATTQQVVRNFINLRYQLLPYNYALMYDNLLYGIPPVKPMVYYEPTNALTYHISDQYYWGERMIVAPIITQGQTSRVVYLPSGQWYDYFHQQWISGGGNVNVNASIDQMPLFMKDGSLIPSQRAKSSTDFMIGDSLFITYYSSTDQKAQPSACHVYEDDGSNHVLQSFSYDDIQLRTNGFAANGNLNFNVMNLVQNNWSGKLNHRFMEFKVNSTNTHYPTAWIQNMQTSQLVQLKKVYTNTDFQNTDSCFYADPSNALYVHFTWNNSAETNVTFRTDVNTGIETVPDFAVISLYPNPATNFFYLSLETIHAADLSVNMYDLQGKLYFQKQLPLKPENPIVPFDLTDLSIGSGIYLVQIKTDNQSKTFKVLLQKD